MRLMVQLANVSILVVGLWSVAVAQEHAAEPNAAKKKGAQLKKTAVGVIQKIDARQRTITVKPQQQQQIQTQKTRQIQGLKETAGGGHVFFLADTTMLRLPSGVKGLVAPAEECDQEKPAQASDKHRPKPPPVPVQQDDKDKPKPPPVPVQQDDKEKPQQQVQITELKVGQTVRIVYEQKDGKQWASQVRVITVSRGVGVPR